MLLAVTGSINQSTQCWSKFSNRGSIFMPDITRRSLVAGAAASLTGARALRGANDRIRTAILGLGGRGGDHLKLAAQVPGVEVATFCDPDETQLQKRGAQFEQLTGKKPR